MNNEIKPYSEAEDQGGIKATLVVQNQFGFIVQRHVRLIRYGLSKAASMDYGYNRLSVQYVAKGKRKPVGYKFRRVTIAKGWQDVPGCFNNPAPGQTEFAGFDKSEYERLAGKLENIVVEFKR
jgi:hypothetical protein